MADLKQYITNIPDFSEKGIIFRDVTFLLQSAEGFNSGICAALLIDSFGVDTLINTGIAGSLKVHGKMKSDTKK